MSEYDINKVTLETEAKIKINGLKTKMGQITYISNVAESNTRTFEIIIEADNDDLSFKSGLTSTIIIEISSVKAHKISPSILTLQDDGNIGVKAISKENIVIFYKIEKVKDTIDGMWVTGLPESVRLITTGQEYIAEGEIVKINN